MREKDFSALILTASVYGITDCDLTLLQKFGLVILLQDHIPDFSFVVFKDETLLYNGYRQFAEKTFPFLTQRPGGISDGEKEKT